MTFKPRPYTIKNIPTLRGGMNTQQSPNEIGDFEMADCENMTIEENAVALAAGFVQYDKNPEAGPIHGGYQFVLSNTTRVNIRQIGTKLQYDSDGNGDWQDCTLPTIGSPAASITLSEVKPTFVTLNDIVLFSNGEESVLSSEDGITWIAQPTLPKAAIVANNGKNRIVFTKIKATPSILWWSEINNPLTVDSAAWQFIDPNNGEEIIGHGLDPIGNNYIFKTNSFYSISDFVDDGIIDVNFRGRFRIASHASVQTTEDSIMAAGQDGIYELQGGVMRKISGNIKNAGRNDIVRPELIVAAYHDSKYYVSMPDNNINDDYNSQEYVVHRTIRTGNPIQPYAITRNRRYFGCYWMAERKVAEDTEFRIYTGESVDVTLGSPAVSASKTNFINYLKSPAFVGGLNGVAQEAYFTTKFFTENAPFFSKKFKKTFADMASNNDFTVIMGYRFTPNGAFIEASESFIAETLVFLLEDGTYGGFVEGFDFVTSQDGSFQPFFDVENADKPRGIQLRIRIESISDVSTLGLAYKTRVKNKFK